jgi:hypothetical protein
MPRILLRGIFFKIFHSFRSIGLIVTIRAVYLFFNVHKSIIYHPSYMNETNQKSKNIQNEKV